MGQVKKYCTYHLEVNYTNGDKETLKINGIHEKGNKKEAMDFYRREKDKYIQDSKVATIEFIGTTPEGKTWVQFTKEVNVIKEQATEDFVQENLEKDVRDVVSEINDRIELLIKQNSVLNDRQIICTKSRDTLLHKVGLIKNKEFFSKKEEIIYRLSLLNELEANEEDRRNAKLNLADIGNVLKAVIGIQDKLKPFCKTRKEFTLNPDEYEEMVEKTVKYRTDKERLHYMSQLQSKYDRVVNDSAKKELYFYNKVGQGRKKSKAI